MTKKGNCKSIFNIVGFFNKIFLVYTNILILALSNFSTLFDFSKPVLYAESKNEKMSCCSFIH